MDYFEAQQKIDSLGSYASADFYRMQTSMSIALGLRDQPQQILADVVAHGSQESRDLLQWALAQGYVQELNPAEGVILYDVVDIDNSGAPYYFRSHIAMQIASPWLYWEFYDNEHVWNFNHPKMQALVDLCISCLTNKKHPSDYFGEHEIPDEKRKPGRPRLTKQKQPKTGYKEWIAACKQYTVELKGAWDHYLAVCRQRQDAAAQIAEWRNAQLDRLRAQMTEISNQYDEKLVEWDNAVERAKHEHTLVKQRGKPKRDEFE